MAFVVEDGTGLSTATSYLSVAGFKTYHTDRGNDFAPYSDTSIERALVLATDFIDRRYRYVGVKANGRDQAREWPRQSAYDPDDWLVNSDTVPAEITDATAELGFIALGESLIPNPSWDATGNALTESTDSVGQMRRTRRYSVFGTRHLFKEFPTAEACLRRLARLEKRLVRAS